MSLLSRINFVAELLCVLTHIQYVCMSQTDAKVNSQDTNKPQRQRILKILTQLKIMRHVLFLFALTTITRTTTTQQHCAVRVKITRRSFVLRALFVHSSVCLWQVVSGRMTSVKENDYLPCMNFSNLQQAAL
ncbi:unnamed protein product [Ceratitis capitata]|uniref:(Mediterranean fruit fly) hypothetical protein n=1 Tax=Ceratitis capitata TaxID=7213 RepID=A0A811V674_CERCA|nr:unnamed protein product [Ceratitis capitata]